MRLLMTLGVIAIASCASNRGAEEPEARVRDTTFKDTLNPADTSHGTREMPDSADSRSRRTLEVPGDSVRLEDTLSVPPASGDSVRSQR